MGEVEFRRNKDTGILEVWKDGKFVGNIITYWDHILGNVRKIPNFMNPSRN